MVSAGWAVSPSSFAQNEFYNAGSIDAGVLFVTCCLFMLIYTKARPPGIAYTYCWLLCCALSLLASDDGKALAACAGLGVNGAWYTTQLVHRGVWTSLLPYWEAYVPKWLVHPFVRIGDLVIHPIPMAFFLRYLKLVDFRVAIYALLMERWYFILVERQLVGTGTVLNTIYQPRPRFSVQVYHTCQVGSAVWIVLAPVWQIESWPLRRFSQLVISSSTILFLLARTNRTKVFDDYIRPVLFPAKVEALSDTDPKKTHYSAKVSPATANGGFRTWYQDIIADLQRYGELYSETSRRVHADSGRRRREWQSDEEEISLDERTRNIPRISRARRQAPEQQGVCLPRGSANPQSTVRSRRSYKPHAGGDMRSVRQPDELTSPKLSGTSRRKFAKLRSDRNERIPRAAEAEKVDA